MPAAGLNLANQKTPPIDEATSHASGAVHRLVEGADFVPLAAEPDADMRRVRIPECALEKI